MTDATPVSRTYDYTGKVVFITGAARGFGAAFARDFAGAGAISVVTDVDLALAESVAAAIREAGGQALALSCDVAAEEDVDRAVAEVIERLGGVDILINNAGLHLTRYSQPFSQMPRSDIRRLLDVNLMGVINCTLACRQSMIDRGGGAIVNLASISAYLADNPYAVSKLAVRGLTLAFARELGPAGIRVNGIAPGLMATDMAVADLPPELFTRFIGEFQQVKRRGEVSDVVEMALFLCSPQAGFVTGETIKVSGGYPLTL